ncbi:MAG: signal peptidase I [Patescibacteria group bacterium]|jgi:signal peptidase I
MKITYDSEGKEKQIPKKQEEIPSFAQSPKGFIFELLKIVLIALAIILPIRYFLFQPFYVRGASMEPNFQDNQYLIIDEITYRFSEPNRGDVVVIKPIINESDFLIKRIIGLPNETVEINGGKVTIFNDKNPQGLVLKEDYLSSGLYTNGSEKIKLGADEYFVMGDNRPVSLDSRSFGSLDKKNIVGRAWLRVWPFSEFQHFAAPQYNF